MKSLDRLVEQQWENIAPKKPTSSDKQPDDDKPDCDIDMTIPKKDDDDDEFNEVEI